MKYEAGRSAAVMPVLTGINIKKPGSQSKKIFLCLTLFFVLSLTSVSADIFMECERDAFPGSLIRLYVVANQKITNLYVMLNTENGEKIARFDGFKYNPGQITGFSNILSNIECMVVIISTGSTIKSGKYQASVYINNEDSPKKEFPIVIVQKEFEKETIPLNKSLSGLRTDNSERKEKESQSIYKLLSTFNKENVFTDAALMKPLTAEPCKITSKYGEIRKFVYTDGGTGNSIHNGIDYAAVKGSPVYSCAFGRVVFAGYRLVTGNSVIIEHLPGLYSLYYHLDSLSVTENTFVAQGTKIGLLGSTGLATGPHLHWEIRNQKITVDPDFLIANSLIDKDKIISIIKSDFTDMAGGR